MSKELETAGVEALSNALLKECTTGPLRRLIDLMENLAEPVLWDQFRLAREQRYPSVLATLIVEIYSSDNVPQELRSAIGIAAGSFSRQGENCSARAQEDQHRSDQTVSIGNGSFSPTIHGNDAKITQIVGGRDVNYYGLNDRMKDKSVQRQILYVGAQNAQERWLNTDTEVKAIQDSLLRSRNRDLFYLKPRVGVTYEDSDWMCERPFILHIAAHGCPDGSIVFPDSNGEDKIVPPEGIASVIRTMAGGLRCVVLACCYSERLADRLAGIAEHIIGTTAKIYNGDVVAFAQGFYGMLGEGGTIQEAYSTGKALVDVRTRSEDLTGIWTKR